MTSKKTDDKEAYVWIWLPEETDPVVAGRLATEGKSLVFNYGQSYLARDNAISIFKNELPLKSGVLPLLTGLTMPGCLRDAAPDAWGRRVILNKKFGKKFDAANVDLGELTYLLESGSDRIGALDFQQSNTVYEPRISVNTNLEELLESAERVQKGIPLTPELDQALHHGSSIGGARPKALITDGSAKYVAKFSASADIYNVVKAEFIAMRLAHLAGINVAPVTLVKSSHKDVLLIERFDRVLSAHGWQRKSMVSALTILSLDEMMARYASYEDLAQIIRKEFRQSASSLKELFSRIVFNILSGNTDDHARNHAAFWDGEMLELTPAYDICPQGRTGFEASQAMLISGNDRASQIASCLTAAHVFQLSSNEAIRLIEHQIETIGNQWIAICEVAELNQVDRKLLWGSQFLNPYAFYGLSEEAKYLEGLAEHFRSKNQF
ncbi:MAG: HipA domain-containing protein [Methylotenera sp.]|nr:HipA domain-containing protein [Methylotenera sp.]MDO9234050.1 HipA domain-containing protein [Methylotenera sp.]MDO9388731.1 HipA domain-containing protein [Methylotenera sp.]MDP2403186.1 HipA domain-containing protein [Methylotenera sp.]MDP3096050.1 HipA domain-containing protein [Methylotenera sp.]